MDDNEKRVMGQIVSRWVAAECDAADLFYERPYRQDRYLAAREVCNELREMFYALLWNPPTDLLAHIESIVITAAPQSHQDAMNAAWVAIRPREH